MHILLAQLCNLQFHIYQCKSVTVQAVSCTQHLPYRNHYTVKLNSHVSWLILASHCLKCNKYVGLGNNSCTVICHNKYHNIQKCPFSVSDLFVLIFQPKENNCFYELHLLPNCFTHCPIKFQHIKGTKFKIKVRSCELEDFQICHKWSWLSSNEGYLYSHLVVCKA